MDKIKEKINFKDKRVYIPLIIVGILLAILLLFGISNLVSKLSKEKEKKFSSTAKEVEFIDQLVNDPNRKEITVSAKENEKCVNDICVENVKVTCYKNRGIIDFTVKNNSSSTSSGYLNLTIGDYSAVIWYDSTAPGKTYSGFHTYDGDEYDLRGADSKDYRVRAIDDDDKSSISTYKYYSCLTNRNYYEVDFEGNRVFRNGDEDYTRTSCIKRSDANHEITFVDHFFNPCKSGSEESGVTIISQCEYENTCVENSSGQCEFGGTGGNTESNNCVKYERIETVIDYDDEGKEFEKQEVKTYCGRKDSNGYINSSAGRLKCESYALCVDGGCYPFCEDLTANNK